MVSLNPTFPDRSPEVIGDVYSLKQHLKTPLQATVLGTRRHLWEAFITSHASERIPS